MRRLPLELIERLRALRPKPETPQDHLGFVATAAGVYFLIAAVIEVWRFLVADIIKPIWSVVRLMLSALLILVVAATTVSAGPNDKEAAALALQAQGKLHCHRNMQATSWINTNDAGYNNAAYYESDINPVDQTFCGLQSLGHPSIYATATLSAVSSGLNGQMAMELTGHFHQVFVQARTWNNDAPPTGRMGARFYKHQSTDDFCEESKITQVGTYWTFSGALGGPIVWGADASGVSGSNTTAFRGKWWRWEMYFEGDFTAPTSTSIHIKNITDNTAEISRTGVTSGLWTGGAIPSLIEPVHQYYDRQTVSTAPTCTTQYMYVLVAKNLDGGERIPPAVEVEGAPANRGFILRIAVPLLIAIGLAVWRATAIVS